MKDRFELETEILSIHSFAENLRDLSNALCEEQITSDELGLALDGVAVLIDIHAAKLYDTMCQTLKLNQWGDNV